MEKSAMEKRVMEKPDAAGRRPAFPVQPRAVPRHRSGMRNFTWACGSTVYFENTSCLNCGRSLGFVPQASLLTSFEDAPEAPEAPDSEKLALHPRLNRRSYRYCRNQIESDTCNWMIPSEQPADYCLSCRLNETIPNLDDPRRVQLWYEVEKAKRRTIFTLLALGLPIHGKADAPKGLSFKILSDRRLDADVHATDERASTGHLNGTITISLAEADPSLREEMRERLNEGYRTLLGHVRHEVGHYYWFLLIDGSPALTNFRALFGDERADYASALNAHYDSGPPADWQRRHVSAYASSHPWEDFAETWAHYMHIIDTLETASDSDLQFQGKALGRPTHDFDPELNLDIRNPQADFTWVLDDWFTLSQGMNLLNRSMGLGDAYPFALSATAQLKLGFVHRLVVAHERS